MLRRGQVVSPTSLAGVIIGAVSVALISVAQGLGPDFALVARILEAIGISGGILVGVAGKTLAEGKPAIQGPAVAVLGSVLGVLVSVQEQISAAIPGGFGPVVVGVVLYALAVLTGAPVTFGKAEPKP